MRDSSSRNDRDKNCVAVAQSTVLFPVWLRGQGAVDAAVGSVPTTATCAGWVQPVDPLKLAKSSRQNNLTNFRLGVARP